MNLRELGTPWEWLGDTLAGALLVIGMPLFAVALIVVFR